ncbi:phosphoribosylglycinamide formyltransferase [Facklamia sp. DSM 111018]|uniref:Phosphoribosylglycinamide formyltransferase n=1 Tax=Facklamia lactis TaxID=2749967 RepID=A0ABS0LME8_9LACT|nr:phosphoribosylglycinamide formyltransferase [Facklamia lactis]MBG9980002.1 phosphoribosylglycinamide formyltransferase [Facklamia lactis]MBG9985318.1 phosphoribosylglycinamide formyltransferase [Facklamia lactis]
MRFAIFASGSGSNFQKIVESHYQNPKVEFVFLFTDQKQAYAIQRAKMLGVPVKVAQPKDFPVRLEYEKYLVELCQEAKVDYILLAGYMRIIGSPLLNAYANRIINIHPSLLPDFPGRTGIADAYNAGVTETGVTVHLVDEGIDTGPILAQEKVTIDEGDTLADLETKIHQIEHQLYPRVVGQLIEEGKRYDTSIN